MCDIRAVHLSKLFNVVAHIPICVWWLLDLLWNSDTFRSELIYLLLVGIIKDDILVILSTKFFSSPRARAFIHSRIHVMFATYFAAFYATYFDYIPVENSWEFQVSRHCLEVESLPYASGVISMLSDIYALVLLIPFI